MEGAVLGVDNLVEVEKAKPGQFRVVVDYAKEYPELAGTGFGGSAKFISEFPDVIQAAVDAHIIVYRRLYDEPDWFLAQAKKLLPLVKDEVLKEQYQEFVVKNRLWNPNGYLGEKEVKAMADHYLEIGSVTKPLSPEQWRNITFLQNALKKLGTYKFKS